MEGGVVTAIRFAGVTDISPVRAVVGLKLLSCRGGGLADLSPLKGMKLTYLNVWNTSVTDLSPLQGMPLKELGCPSEPKRHAEILRSIKMLETINGKPAAEFWKEVDAKGPDRKP